MGSKTTKLFKNSTQSSSNDNSSQCRDQLNNCENHQPAETAVKNPISPFVYTRRGSMYIDEDGDTAHEFYVEKKVGSKVTLEKIGNQHLKPQGDVPLDVPCISNDYPVVLLDQNLSKE